MKQYIIMASLLIGLVGPASQEQGELEKMVGRELKCLPFQPKVLMIGNSQVEMYYTPGMKGNRPFGVYENNIFYLDNAPYDGKVDRVRMPKPDDHWICKQAPRISSA